MALVPCKRNFWTTLAFIYKKDGKSERTSFDEGREMVVAGDGTFLQYATTQRGRIMLIYGGYKYVENRQSHKNIFWRCSRYVKYGCRATVVTSKVGTEVTVRISGSPHTHDPEVKMGSVEDSNAIKEYIFKF